MDVAAYIASGILEAYALEALSPQERAEVARALARYPALRAELAAIEAALEATARAEAVMPRKDLRDKVLNQIEEDVFLTKESNIPGLTKKRKQVRYVAIAVFISLWLMSVYGFVKTQKLESELRAIAYEKTQLAENYQQVCTQAEHDKKMRERMLKEIELVSNQGYTRIELLRAANSPAGDSSGSALVYWSKKDKQTYFICSLNSPPPGRQYQLWAISKGQPVNAGMIAKDGGKLKLQNMQKIQAAEAFAVTLEPDGGSPKPTLSAMYIMGTVSAGDVM